MKSTLDTYQVTRIQTAPRGHLVVILYDVMIKFLNRAVENIGQDNYSEYDKNIHKAQNVLSELLAYLNIEEGGEISTSLYRLYRYFKTQLREANQTHNKEKIKHMIGQTKELRAAWNETAKAVRKTGQENFIAREILNFLA